MFGLSSLAIYAIIGAVLFGSGALSGWRVESWHRDSLDVKAEQLAELQVKAEADKAAAASAELEKEKQSVADRIAAATKVVDKIILRPVYRNVCLDSDGLLAANGALQGSSPDPGQSHPALPGPKPLGGRIGSGGPKKAR